MRLLTPWNEVPPEAASLPALRRRLESGQSLGQSIAGSRAIRRLSVHLQAANMDQALRSTVLIAHFDGHQTIWCPVGDFFGSGVGLNPYRDWNREVDRTGLLTCWWVMPFAESCRIELLATDQKTGERLIARGKDPCRTTGRAPHYCC